MAAAIDQSRTAIVPDNKKHFARVARDLWRSEEGSIANMTPSLIANLTSFKAQKAAPPHGPE
jgi:hypothetical protein